MINIRNAKQMDLDRIETIYNYIHDEEEKGQATIGWIRDIYPVRKTAEDTLEREELFVMEDNDRIVAAAIINQIQVPEYADAAWKHTANETEIMVLHTLVVDPLEKKKGYGKAFVAFYEEYAQKHHCMELRMDTNVINQRARKMYHNLGYEEVDIVPCVFNGIPDVQLVCLEKYRLI